MPDLTDAHRAEARRCVTLAGMPPPADEAARARRSELVEALAVAIALAELRGPGPDLAAAWDEGFEAGHQWWNVGMSGIPHDPPRNPHALEHAVGGLLETDEPQPDEPLCPHPRGHVLANEDGLRYCPDCGDVEVSVDSHDAVAEALTAQRPDPVAAHAAAADRLSWSGSEGLIITPPPTGESR